MTPDSLEHFRGRLEPELFEYAMQVATQGVLTRSDCAAERLNQTAYPTFEDDPIYAAQGFWSDLLKGRIFLVTDECSPLLGDLMEK